MNKRGIERTMIAFMIAIVFLVAAAFAFNPTTYNNAKNWINSILPKGVSLSEETPIITYDEERVPEGTKIDVEPVPNTKPYSSGNTIIIKQEFNKAWNLISLFDASGTFSDSCPWWMSKEECSNTDEPLLANKPLLEILSSQKVYGIITINGVQYSHILNEKDTDPNTPDLVWCIDSNNDGKYTEGTDTLKTNEEIKEIILRDLYQEATS